MSYRRPALALLLALVVCCAPTKATGRAARTLQQAPQPAAADGAAADGAAAAPAPAGLRGSDKDARLLLALKDSLENGDAVLASWQPGSDPCAWEGVTCDASGAVTVLQLSNAGLQGTIPSPAGWPLPPTMRELLLGNTAGAANQLRGPIPPGWQLPPNLQLLFLAGNPIGGPLSGGWALPRGLATLQVEGCNLTGPLPAIWGLPPALGTANFDGNQLTGSIPDYFTQLKSLRKLSFVNNRMSGALPASFTFNSSNELRELSVGGNNFTGQVPSWPDQPGASLSIRPGNEGLCGLVPESPNLIAESGTDNFIQSLPPCPEDETSSSDAGGLSGGAIAGIVVGAVAGVALILGGAALVWRRREQQGRMAAAAAKEGASAKSTESNAAVPKEAFTYTTGNPDGTAPKPLAFNPFAARVASMQSNSDSGGSARAASSHHSSTPTTSSRRMPIASAIMLLRGGGGGSGSGGSDTSAASEAQLRQLDGEAQLPDIIPPARLSLEQSAGGRLVLLGKGSSALVYRAWLERSSDATGVAAASASAVAAGSSTDNTLLTGSSSGGEGTVVAAKILGAGDLKAFLHEASILQRLGEQGGDGSDCVVALHGVCMASSALVVVMECVDGGDLRTALSGDSPPRWGAGGRQIAIDIAAGLTCLHAHNVTHRDLKSKNVLLTSAGRAKVADVGTAALHAGTYLSSSSGGPGFAGTLAWAAPELLLGKRCTNKVDVYSLGVVLFEIATLQTPQRGITAAPPPSPDCPPGLAQLISKCLQPEPELRPTAAEALARLRAL